MTTQTQPTGTQRLTDRDDRTVRCAACAATTIRRDDHRIIAVIAGLLIVLPTIMLAPKVAAEDGRLAAGKAAAQAVADMAEATGLSRREMRSRKLPQVQRVNADPVATLADIPGYRDYSGYIVVRQKSVERLRAEGWSKRRAKRQHRRAWKRLRDLDIGHALSQRESGEGWMVIEVPEGVSDRVMCEMLNLTGDYDYVEPDWVVQPLATTPNDSYYLSQYHHELMNSPVAWDITQGSSEIIIGICDTGIDTDHPDLASNRVSGYNAVENLAEVDGGTVKDIHGHGTSTAGCAAAIGNNGAGVAGMGWNFRHMTCRVSNSAGGSAYTSDLVEAAIWAVDNGAKVVNVSYSGVESATVATCGTYIKNAGGLLTWSAGNDATQLYGDHADVIVVGATDQNDNIAWFSNYGAMVDVVAPGYSVTTCGLSGTYQNMSGTSFSAPIVAGVIAMMWAANPNLTPDEVETLLYTTCVDLGDVGEDTTFGQGRVDMGAAVTAAHNASSGGGGGGGGGGDPTLILEISPSPIYPGRPIDVSLTNGTPGAVICLFITFDGPSVEGHAVPRLGVTLDLTSPLLAARPKRANDLGIVQWTIKTRRQRGIPSTMWFQAATFEGPLSPVMEMSIAGR